MGQVLKPGIKKTKNIIIKNNLLPGGLPYKIDRGDCCKYKKSVLWVWLTLTNINEKLININ